MHPPISCMWQPEPEPDHSAFISTTTQPAFAGTFNRLPRDSKTKQKPEKRTREMFIFIVRAALLLRCHPFLFEHFISFGCDLAFVFALRMCLEATSEVLILKLSILDATWRVDISAKSDDDQIRPNRISFFPRKLDWHSPVPTVLSSSDYQIISVELIRWWWCPSVGISPTSKSPFSVQGATTLVCHECLIWWQHDATTMLRF